MKLNGKNVVITGASSGVGEALAFKVAESGGTPILLARNVEKLQQISQTIEQKYLLHCPFYQLDVQDLEKVNQTFRTIIEDTGTIHVLANNAGFGVFDEVIDINLTEMKDMFEVNVFGLIACTKAVLPSMIEQNEGHIINVASQAGKIATPKSSVYSASKHAVLGFTNSLRMELRDTNIFVTAVNPGPIATGFFDIADKSGNYKKSVERFMLEPDFVAEKIIDAMFTPKREINLPGWMNAASKFSQVFPEFVEKVGGKAFYKK
ncbi:short-subunit dehydrogenase [Bacillus mesophilus]|uniref:SDR family oxidoreductase n=1 Tax=Bacillus mesophilus TaxID=1808955 RepID=A0A6M0Q514_9BACI|nr:SDR family oxidoreductase [Bacillus mesophilus]MBM7660982.1 short-subunit dehydrogenase [Bacillus mesophilus]NEY71476.1 SDR family oxidoreductase [Bacillus mesophilus]